MESSEFISVDFWKKSFAPRTDKWKRATLKYLKNNPTSPFETHESIENQIKALKQLLNK